MFGPRYDHCILRVWQRGPPPFGTGTGRVQAAGVQSVLGCQGGSSDHSFLSLLLSLPSTPLGSLSPSVSPPTATQAIPPHPCQVTDVTTTARPPPQQRCRHHHHNITTTFFA
ncbi:hypothetical protein E2C01_029481 [Portunus trituberculatus]|uniref:Uncharacterized protein n=1 Tax=Portunus trituberculatus TaxID=210409 RepID=A0A5B7ES00_PORTR|nr:hypothetical protein [Portunus trituberculatus]